MKKVLFIFLALAVVCGGLFASGSQEKADSKPIIGMATDTNGLGDGSFNDGVYSGLKRAEDEGLIEIRLIEPTSMTDYVPNLSGLSEDGAGLIFATGFLFYDAVLEVSEHYPETVFAGIDLSFDPSTMPSNVIGITWKEQEASYLAGVVAGLMTDKYSNLSDKLNDKNVIGAVLGMDIPPVERYIVGFTQGAKSVNPDIEVLSVVTGTFTDQAKGKEAAIALSEQGADIVIQLAGLTGIGVFNAAQEKGFAAMGCDIDQSFLAKANTITSARKGISEATYLTIKNYLSGDLKSGSNSEFGLAEGAINLAPFNDFEDIIPLEVREAVEKAKAGILDGSINVYSTRAELGM